MDLSHMHMYVYLAVLQAQLYPVPQPLSLPLPTAWTYGGAAPRIWKQSASGQSGILIILQANQGEDKVF